MAIMTPLLLSSIFILSWEQVQVLHQLQQSDAQTQSDNSQKSVSAVGKHSLNFDLAGSCWERCSGASLNVFGILWEGFCCHV